MVVSRQLPGSLLQSSDAASIADRALSGASVALSPSLRLSSLGRDAVDSIQTLWGTSPFPETPHTHAPMTAVLEFSLQSSTTGSSIDLQSLVQTSGSATTPGAAGTGSMPVHFWVETSAGRALPHYECMIC